MDGNQELKWHRKQAQHARKTESTIYSPFGLDYSEILYAAARPNYPVCAAASSGCPYLGPSSELTELGKGTKAPF